MSTRRSSQSRAHVALAVCAFAAATLGCGDDLPLEVSLPPVVIRLVPGDATVAVGDTVPLYGSITGGSPTTPPTVAKCTVTQPNVASVVQTLTSCKVAGLTVGTTDIIAMASTGQVDTATVVVFLR